MIRFCTFVFILATIFPSYSLTREEGLEFIMNSLQQADKAQYTEDFFIKNIESSFRAKEELSWGDSVPDREFLHFVLPVRVNNEALDTARIVFYDELKERVNGMSMKEAILEINHWCHEKVTYKPSDERTSSPLSTVSQAIGRCGEESTFTVAALRALCIPARQIYTPRWAHTDDNHAWVEAWADGEWHFLGACEPEPVLDLAWFNEPASRGVLMTTNVTGPYTGDEEVISQNDLITKINVTSNYAPTSQLPVKVIRPDGSPVQGAAVNFSIYNYAEFFPSATRYTDEDGNASLSAGLGDLIVWATDGKKFGFVKANPSDYDALSLQYAVVMLDKDKDYEGEFDFDIAPPPARSKKPFVSAEQRNLNDSRLALEDSIRNSYVATFADMNEIAQNAKGLNLPEDKLKRILLESRGNHINILKTLSALPFSERLLALDLLDNISEKDRRDITSEAILDHIANVIPIDEIVYSKGNLEDSASLSKEEVYNKYILNPRIEHEYIFPWRKFVSEYFTPEQATSFKNNPAEIAGWISENVKVSTGANSSNLRMNPEAVLKMKESNKVSRNICFVGVSRAIGIPARIDAITGMPQWLDSQGQWHDAEIGDLNSELVVEKGKGKINLLFSPQGYVTDPNYYSQFSISRVEDGKPRQLEFDWGAAYSDIFAEPLTLEEGQYLLTTGQRMADGSVLSHNTLFTLTANEIKGLPLIIRQDSTALSVIGNLDAENIYHDLATDTDKSLLSTTGRGYYVLGLISPNHEPSAHALNDLSDTASTLEKDGRKIMILFDDTDKASRFNSGFFPNLPSNVVFGIDNGGKSRKDIMESLNLENVTDPIFIVADSFNRIVWISTGYTIGLGEQLMSVLSRVK